MIKLIKSGKRLTTIEIENFEKLHEIVLPIEYKNFLLLQNGGIPENNYFELRLFDINEENTNSFIKIEKFYSLEELPIVWLNVNNYLSKFSLFPIAEIEGGMLICINTSKENNGQVYFYDFEIGKINIGFLEVFITHLINKDNIDLFKYDTNEDFFIEEEIINKGEINDLLSLLKGDFNTDKIVDNYGRRLIELATIQGNLEFVKLIYENGSKFYNAIEIAKDNFKYFPEDGFKEIIEFIEKEEKINKS